MSPDPLDQSTEWLELLNEHPIFSDGIANENIECEFPNTTYALIANS